MSKWSVRRRWKSNDSYCTLLRPKYSWARAVAASATEATRIASEAATRVLRGSGMVGGLLVPALSLTPLDARAPSRHRALNSGGFPPAPPPPFRFPPPPPLLPSPPPPACDRAARGGQREAPHT